MINVQQRTLGAFKHDVFTSALDIIEPLTHVKHHGRDTFSHGHGFVENFLKVQWLFLVIVLQGKIQNFMC